jgi:hypothetical protein
MGDMKARSLGEVIARMGLPAECMDEIVPLDDANFQRRAGQLIARSTEPPPTPPRRAAVR